MFEENFTLEKYKTGEYETVTKDGDKVRILCTDANCDFPIFGLVRFQENDVAHAWTMNGKSLVCLEKLRLMLKKKRLKPKKGDKYWYLNSYFRDFYETEWNDEDWDEERYEIGNCFQTKEEAEENKKELLKIFDI